VRVGDLIGGWDLCSIVREINRLRARFQANAGRRPLSEHIVYIGNPAPVKLGPNRQGASRGVSKDPRPVLLDAQSARHARFKQRPGVIVNSIMTMGDPFFRPMRQDLGLRLLVGGGARTLPWAAVGTPPGFPSWPAKGISTSI